MEKLNVKYAYGVMVQTHELPRYNNMWYSYGDPGTITYVHSYNTLIGIYDKKENVFIEWAHYMKYSPTTSKQATKVSNYLSGNYQTTIIRASDWQTVEKFTKERNIKI